MRSTTGSRGLVLLIVAVLAAGCIAGIYALATGQLAL